MLSVAELFVGDASAEVLVVASDQRQANITLRLARRMIELNPKLADRAQVYADRIRIANGVTAGFVAEGAQISDGDVAFDEVTLLPSTRKGLKVLVKLSNELIRTSVVGLDAVLRTRLVTDVANALDAALWDGAGTSNTIKASCGRPGSPPAPSTSPIPIP
jgi:HK97 family phage major capsid protein